MEFTDLAGHQDIKETLIYAMINDKVNHAYVFTGNRGIGKRSMALAFSKMLLCAQPLNDKPCGRCISCQTFEADTHPDFNVVTTQKSSIGVEEIRHMQSEIIIKPVYGIRKVYLIPDAHLMTAQAQNCLLKTLEEPPVNTCILLTTSNYDALLQTIRSRTVKVSFRPLDDETMDRFLRSKYEACDDRTIKFVVSYAGGIAGRAIDYLESDEQKEIRDKCFELVQVASASQSLVMTYSEYFEEKKDEMDMLLTMLELVYRDHLVLKLNQEKQLINSDKRDMIISNVKNMTFTQITNTISLIGKSRRSLRMNANFRLVTDHLLMNIREAKNL